MSPGRRLAHMIWGAEVDRALRPLLVVTLATTIPGAAWWSFMGIWAVDHLHAKGQLPFAFAIGAILAAFSGYIGGHLSDHIGRRRLLLVAESGIVLYPLGLIAIGDRLWPGLVALALAGVIGSLGGSVSQALVADLVPPEKHEAAYAATRVAQNLGVVFGPVLAGLLLLAGSWNALFLGVSSLGVFGWIVAYRLLPRRGAYSPESPPERGSLGVIVRDKPFLLFLGSALFAWLVYVAYQELLPIALVDGYGYEPAAWGFLVWINPLLVTLFQLRLTRSLEGVGAAPKLAVAMLVMGLPFLLLTVTTNIVVIVIVVTVFVFGEMMWVPTSQSVVAKFAPEDIRGAYMGAFGSAPAVGFSLAPLVGLSIRNAYGDATMWTFFAAVSVVAAVLGALAVQGARGERRSAVLET